jgi:hypothetical protein
MLFLCISMEKSRISWHCPFKYPNTNLFIVWRNKFQHFLSFFPEFLSDMLNVVFHFYLFLVFFYPFYRRHIWIQIHSVRSVRFFHGSGSLDPYPDRTDPTILRTKVFIKPCNKIYRWPKGLKCAYVRLHIINVNNIIYIYNSIKNRKDPDPDPDP